MAVNTMKKGALDFIQKPFDEEDALVGLVERMLDHAREAFSPATQQAASRDALLSQASPAARHRCSSASSPAD